MCRKKKKKKKWLLVSIRAADVAVAAESIKIEEVERRASKRR
jgi:hypothetical protein